METRIQILNQLANAEAKRRGFTTVDNFIDLVSMGVCPADKITMLVNTAMQKYADQERRNLMCATRLSLYRDILKKVNKVDAQQLFLFNLHDDIYANILELERELEINQD